MTHLFVSREYPPAHYPPGGIGTYLRTITTLLAEAGETVHVIAHRWDGAPDPRHVSMGGRLTIHRVALDSADGPSHQPDHGRIAKGMLESTFPSQAFSWQASLLAEQLIEHDGIDVIEAQEWEAPLYYLQRRRSLNLGPSRRPPCVVHLHSSTEQIFGANTWDLNVADYAPAAAMEAYSIAAADALLCPSHFMLEQTHARYGVDRSRFDVIRYPLGHLSRLDRASRTWAYGSICHVGRLEPRKGVLEWADAIAKVSPEHPALTFEFIGGDTPLGSSGHAMVSDAIRARVPHDLIGRIRFHGSLEREAVVERLRYAWAAVVPSRWENLPYSCLESMASGLPIIASPHGGMKELVEHGVSGWIASDTSGESLAAALATAAGAPPAQRQRMGEAASARVLDACDSQTIVRAHLEFKKRLVERHARTAINITREATNRSKLAVVITKATADENVEVCLASIEAQGEPAADVESVLANSTEDRAMLQSIVGKLGAGDGIVFVRGDCQLHPDCLAICRRVFAADKSIGLLSAWSRDANNRVLIQPLPNAPFRNGNGSVAGFVAIRLSALREAYQSNPARTSTLDVCDAIVNAGWQTLTYPAVLSSIRSNEDTPARRGVRFSPMARAIQRLHTPLVDWLLTSSSEDIRSLVRQGLATPARSASKLLRWTSRG